VAHTEQNNCGVLGEIFRFNGRFRAIDARLPDSFKPKKLSEMNLSGIVWTVILIQRKNNQFDSFPHFATELNGGDRVIFGVRDHGALAAETQLFFDLSRGDLGSANARWYMLDLDCFEFTKDVTGENGAVLGAEMHAAAVSMEHNKSIPALGFRGSYKLNLAGVAMPKDEGGLQVEWLPLPTFVVKPGYWGLVARVPTPPFGRSMRCPQFSTPRQSVALTYPKAMSLSS